MKRVYILLSILLITLSCSTDDAPNFYFDFIPVASVSGFPENFTVNQADTLQVSYFRPSNCHSFDGFEVEKIDAVREITLISKVIEEEGICADLADDLRTAPIVFRPEAAGEVILKFFNGNDADGNPIFLTFNVPIIE